MKTPQAIDPADSEVVFKPKELARMASIGSDPDFGSLVSYRAITRWPILLLLVVPGFFALIGIGSAVTQLSGIARPANTPGPPITSWLPHVTVTLLIAAVLCAPVVWWFRRRDVEYRFFLEGATRFSRKRGLLQRLAYIDVSALTYTLTRQHMNGAYVGTAGKLQLETPKGSGIKGMSLSFNHRERRKGGPFNRRFVGRDPMDVVRDTVADVIAERLALEIAEKGEAAWTGPATFTKDGLRIKKLLGAPAVVAYDKIDRLGFGDGTLVLFEEGSEKAFVSMAVNGKNFWPGFVLFQKLMKPRGGAEEVDATEFEEDGD